MPILLRFVEKTHPILREIMPDIQDFTDPSLHNTLKDMCYSILPQQLKEAGAAHQSAAGMAANQWGIQKRVFLMTPEGSELGKPLEIVMNPSYVPYLSGSQKEPSFTEAYEGCFSIPLTTGLIKRYKTILATYYNMKGEKIERILEGWEARVFQHETDHLNGKLFDGILDNYPGPDCKERIIFKDTQEMDQFWNHKVKPSRK